MVDVMMCTPNPWEMMDEVFRDGTDVLQLTTGTLFGSGWQIKSELIGTKI